MPKLLHNRAESRTGRLQSIITDGILLGARWARVIEVFIEFFRAWTTQKTIFGSHFDWEFVGTGDSGRVCRGRGGGCGAEKF